MTIRRRADGAIHPVNTNPSIFDVLHIEVPPWHVGALCAQADPEAFFPEKGGSTREAKNICRRCPVQAECVDDALAREERFGIWGGLSERERRKVIQATHPERAPVHRNARKTHCLHGHAFDEGNTYDHPSGQRVCRACQADRYKARNEEERPA